MKQKLNDLICTLQQIDRDSVLVISKIVFAASASPEGSLTLNRQLNSQRIEALERYIKSSIPISDSLIIRLNNGVAWGKLRKMVEKSGMQYRDEVLYMIDSIPEITYQNKVVVDSRNSQLMNLKWGRPYLYIMEHFFPQLRSSSIVTLYYKLNSTKLSVSPAKKIEAVSDRIATPITPITYSPSPLEAVPDRSEPIAASRSIRKPILAIKTNLLYDIALVPNIEIELPIGDRWSVAVEAMYAGLRKRDNSFCWEVQSAGLEGRYWLGNRAKRSVLSGWFVGGFASAGFYDFQLKTTKGIQGEFYLLAGASGGYVLPISNRLSFEFSAGVGYVINDYQKYTVVEEKYLVEDGLKRRYQSIMPAKLKVSFVWMLFGNSKRGAAR